MAANKLQWRRIAKGDKLPCQSFLRKKNGEILKLSTGAGVTVGQDAYYLPVDDVIEEIRNYPIEESEDERIRKELLDMCKTLGKSEWIAWLEKQGEQKPIVKLELDENDEPVLTSFESDLFSMMSDAWQGYQRGEEVNIARIVKEHSAELLERANEHKPAEWSEEDGENSKNILYILNQLKGNAIYSEDKIAEKCIDWLKSLKERYTWKPSDEQMTALRRMKNAIGGEGEIYEPLNSLYEDLKKLKEK